MSPATLAWIHDWNPSAPGGRPLHLHDSTLAEAVRDGRRPSPAGVERFLRASAALGLRSLDLGPPGPRTEEWLDRCARLGLEACLAVRHARDLERARRLGPPSLRPSPRAARLPALAGLPWDHRLPAPGRLDPDRLEKAARDAARAGARRLVLDHGGELPTPEQVAAMVRHVTSLGLPLEVLWSDRDADEMAAARGLAALAAGADGVLGTALGLGSRHRRLPLDLVFVNLRLDGLWQGPTEPLREWCHAAADLWSAVIVPGYPVVGADAFRTSTGVHAAAVAKALHRGTAWHADLMYSGVPAGEFGCAQRLELGPMSGRSNAVAWLQQEGLEPTPERVERLLATAKAADRVLSDGELRAACEDPAAPRRLMELRFGYIGSRAIGAAVELDLFSRVAEGHRTLPALKEATGCSDRGLRSLLDALVAQGLLRRRGGEVALAPEAERCLVQGSEGYLGGMILQADTVWNRWSHLAEAVRTGRPPAPGIESDEDGGRYFSAFVQGLYNLNRPSAEEAARHLGPAPRRVLDVGAGSGVWSQPFALQHPGTTVVALDRAEVLEGVTRPYAARAGVEDRYEWREGNFRDVPFGVEEFDLVLLGHVLHSEGRELSLELLRRARRCLRPGGRVLVAEMVPDDERERDLYGLLFGLHMLMLTEQGEVFTRRDLEGLAGQAGLVTDRWLPVPGPYPVLLLAPRPLRSGGRS